MLGSLTKTFNREIKMRTTWLAGFFDKQREIIEAAETPFAKLAVFILPILAPTVPATMTGLHVYKLLLEMFTFSGAKAWAFILSVVVALVLEMLGYVGAVTSIQSLFRWIRTRQDEFILPFALNGLAYVFYLTAMWQINVQLGKYFNTPPIINNVIGLLSFITVPTGLLAANHLSQKEYMDESKELRLERREERMEKYKIKHGAFGGVRQRTNNEQSERTSEQESVRQQILAFVAKIETNDKRTPGPTEIATAMNVSKSYASEVLKERPMGFPEQD